MSSKIQKVFYSFFGAYATVVSAQYSDDHLAGGDYSNEQIEESISDWEIHQNLSIGALLYADIDIKGRGVDTIKNNRTGSLFTKDPRTNSVNSYFAKSDAKPRSLHAEAGFRLVSPSKHYGFGVSLFTGGAVPLVVSNIFGDRGCTLSCGASQNQALKTNINTNNLIDRIRRTGGGNLCPHFTTRTGTDAAPGTNCHLNVNDSMLDIYHMVSVQNDVEKNDAATKLNNLHVSFSNRTYAQADTDSDTAAWGDHTVSSETGADAPILADADIVDGFTCVASGIHGSVIGPINWKSAENSGHYYVAPTRDCSIANATKKVFADRTFYNHLQAVQFEGMYQFNRFNIVYGLFLGRSLTATQPFIDSTVFSSLGVNGVSSSEEYRYLDYKTTAYPVYGLAMNVEYEVAESDEYAFSLSAFGKYAKPVDPNNIYGEQFGASAVGSKINATSKEFDQRDFTTAVSSAAVDNGTESTKITFDYYVDPNSSAHTYGKHQGSSLTELQTVTNIKHSSYIVAGITLSMSKKIDG